jgi:hypothetical protein
VDGRAEAVDGAELASSGLHHVDGASDAHAEPEFFRFDDLHSMLL